MPLHVPVRWIFCCLLLRASCNRRLHAALTGWLTERADWPGATDTPALFLNQRGERLSVRGAHAIITGIAAAGLLLVEGG